MKLDHSPAIIVLGISSGDEVSLKQLLQSTPKDLHACMVVLQCPSAEQQELTSLINLVQNSTPWTVTRLLDGIAPHPGHVYMVAPEEEAFLEQGLFRLSNVSLSPGTDLDRFCLSLVGDENCRCALVILSGNGKDGSRCAKRLKESGGLVIMESSERQLSPEIPMSASEAAWPDLKLPVEEIIPSIASWLASDERASASDHDLMQGLDEARNILKHSAGHDFTGYKEATLTRRLQHRMDVLHTPLPDYLQWLSAHEKEQQTLFHEFLIGVTEFFRDREVFESLSTGILPSLIERADQELRCWVPGCSTGEEAYTLGILILEALDATHRKDGAEKTDQAETTDAVNGMRAGKKIQILATDIDSRALHSAREGFYPASISREISAERLSRFFHPEGTGYRVCQELRDMILFSEHDVFRDPPFSGIHLISCRNLLIYLDQTTQKKTLQAFQFSLLDQGILVLGQSESLEDNSAFEALDGKHRIFARKSGMRGSLVRNARKLSQPSVSGPVDLKKIVVDSILNGFSPPAVLLDARAQILYVWGRTGPYLEMPAGQPTSDIVSLAKPELKAPLSAIIRNAQNNGEESRAEGLILPGEHRENKRLEIVARPITHAQAASGWIIVGFFDRSVDVLEEGSAKDSPTVDRLRNELSHTRKHLQTTIDELQQTNEELRSSNEEAEAANEQLQISNEELEASREELESLNQELLGTNSRLEQKIEELTRANNDAHNLMRSTGIPVLFLDRNLRIQRFSPDIGQILDLEEGDLGRSILRLTTPFAGLDWAWEHSRVLTDEVPAERILTSEDSKTYLMRVLPYRTLEDTIEGAVFTFQDISTQVRQNRELEKYRNQLEFLVEQRSGELARSERFLEQTGQVAKVGGWEMDIKTRRIQWTHVCRELFKIQEEQDFNYDDFIGLLDADHKEPLQNLVSLAISHGRSFDTEVRTDPNTGIDRWFLVSGRAVMEEGLCLSLYGSIQDVTERKTMEKRLQHTTDMLIRTEHAASLGSWEWEIEKDQVIWSDELFSIFGVPSRAGPPSFQEQKALYTEESYRRLLACVHKARESGVPYSVEVEMIRQDDGQHRFGMATGFAVRNGQGKVVRLYGSFQDITERALAQQEALQARDEAHRANQAKSIFLGNLSHELRTPMNAIIGMTELAMEENLKEDVRDYLSTVLDASEHLMSILGDLLDSATMEQGRMELNNQWFFLRQTVDKIIAITEKPLREKGLFYRIHVEEDLPDALMGDERRLMRVLTGVIDNATKFTAEGGVDFRIECGGEMSGSGIRVVNFVISDTGPGIAEEHRETIFEKFTQLGPQKNRLLKQSSGTGMGLYIARNIVQSMGGSISVSSKIGSGTTFLISIPLELARAAAPHGRQEEPGPALPENMAILMAEDNAINALVQKTILEQGNHTVVVAHNGHEALQLLSRGSYDLVLLDLEMPVLDGFETAQAIRAGKAGAKNSDIVIVAISAHVLSEVQDSCIQSGMDGFIEKPVEARALDSELGRIWASRKNS